MAAGKNSPSAGYRRRLEDLLAGARLPADTEISFKSVFGAVGAYAGGRIFISCGKFGVALKLDGETCEALLASGAGRPLKYFDKGHVKRDYVVLSEDILADKTRCRELIRKSAALARVAA